MSTAEALSARLELARSAGYEIVRELDEGPGQEDGVFLVEHRDHRGMSMVLRVPAAPYSPDRRRLLADFRRVRHAHICGIHPLRPDVTAMLSVWERWPGTDIESWLGKRADAGTTLQRTVRMAWVADQVFQAVEHLHDKGFCHLDIKPAHFILDDTGAGKLGGFGQLARKVSVMGLRRYSPSVAPPEVLRGDKVRCVAIDVYQVAATMHWLLTGDFPHYGDDLVTGSSAESLAELTGRRETFYYRNSVAGLSDPWHHFFTRALHPFASSRYADVASMRAEFARLLLDDIQRLLPEEVSVPLQGQGVTNVFRALYEDWAVDLDAGLGQPDEPVPPSPLTPAPEPPEQVPPPPLAPAPVPVLAGPVRPRPPDLSPPPAPLRRKALWVGVPVLLFVLGAGGVSAILLAQHQPVKVAGSPPVPAPITTAPPEAAPEPALPEPALPEPAVTAPAVAAPAVQGAVAEPGPPPAPPPEAPTPALEAPGPVARAKPQVRQASAVPAGAGQEEAAPVAEPASRTGTRSLTLDDGAEVKVKVTESAVYVFHQQQSRRVPLERFQEPRDVDGIADQVRADPASFLP